MVLEDCTGLAAVKFRGLGESSATGPDWDFSAFGKPSFNNGFSRHENRMV